MSNVHPMQVAARATGLAYTNRNEHESRGTGAMAPDCFSDVGSFALAGQSVAIWLNRGERLALWLGMFWPFNHLKPDLEMPGEDGEIPTPKSPTSKGSTEPFVTLVTAAKNSRGAGSLICTVLAVSAVWCQPVWAQPADHSNPLTGYVPVPDELCNYCQDYRVGTVPAGHLATLYQPGIGYPDPVGASLLPMQGNGATRSASEASRS